MSLGDSLAALNALLNAGSAVCLVAGWKAIRHKDVVRHRRRMLTAFGLSVLFLISYLTRFSLTGTHRFPGTGLIRILYLSILLTHTTLAALVPWLVLRTIYLAWKGRIDSHRRLSRWVWPIWLYVSITGVVVYFSLYHFKAPAPVFVP